MSRLFAKYLMETNGIEPDMLANVFANKSIQLRYFKLEQNYEFEVLDFYGYVHNEVFWYKVKIHESDLDRMLRVDNYSDDEKNELYYHKLLGGNGSGVEQLDLDDDVYWGISILQYFFHISRAVMKSAKRQLHLYKLRKVNSPWIELKRWVLHSNGGRKLGSIGEVDMQNIDNADAIIRTCVEKDRFLEYMELSKDLIRIGKLSYGITGAKWKFYILRYQWKLSCGFATRDLEYEKKLLEKNSVYRIFENLKFD